ncbi:MAG TPA: mitochondrial fission ELM1 family protein [Parvularculaceae bacterium]|nr:mitochondrial fission ELM1 family protein [Parvularculaceae bacterium]
METKTDREAFSCWVATDGRAGNENPPLGLAEAIGERMQLKIAVKRLKVKLLLAALPAALWGDPFGALSSEGALLRAPYPDLFVGCGRLSAPFARAIKKRHPRTFVIQLLRPPGPIAFFDLVIPPRHDNLAGSNVFSTLGSPHRATRERLEADARKLAPALGGLPHPRVAVLLGGSNRAFQFGERRAAIIAADLRRLADGGAGLMITASRRTGEKERALVAAALDGAPHFFWSGAPVAGLDNPYFGMLGLAEHILVTEDSVNMAAEAAATGKPVHILALDRAPFARGAAKFARFHEALRAHGAARPFAGALDRWTYLPLEDTARAADEVERRFKEHLRRIA